jgi:hypothetical protein
MEVPPCCLRLLMVAAMIWLQGFKEDPEMLIGALEQSSNNP